MWIPFLLLATIAASLLSPISKHQIKTTHPIATLFLNQVSTIAVMIILILFLGGIPHVTPAFYILTFWSSVLDLIAFICSYWALKNAPVSLLAPLNSFTPAFATFFGFLFLHETPTPMKLLGILTIIIGMYILNIAELKGGILQPFKKLFSQKGVRLYFVQVFIFGITPVFQKQAIFQTHPIMPLYASFMGFLFVTSYLFFIRMKFLEQDAITLTKNKRYNLLFGVCAAFSQLAGYTVFSKIFIGYATALFSLTSLFTVLFGGLLFKEGNIKERLLGASVMIIGTVLLVF